MKEFILYNYLELVDPSLTLVQFKEKLETITGIKKENQRFKIELDYQGDINDHNKFCEYDDDNRVNLFWSYVNLKIYDISKYVVSIERDYYERYAFLDLRKNIEELKQMVFEQTKIPKDRQKFYLNL